VRSFVLIYDTARAHLVERKSFKEIDRALVYRFAAERRFASESSFEIVVVLAESLAKLRQSHPRYFVEELTDRPGRGRG